MKAVAKLLPKVESKQIFIHNSSYITSNLYLDAFASLAIVATPG